MQIQIRDAIEPTAKGRRSRYPFDSLSVGKAFVIPRTDVAYETLRQAVRRQNLANTERQFKLSTLHDVYQVACISDASVSEWRRDPYAFFSIRRIDRNDDSELLQNEKRLEGKARVWAWIVYRDYTGKGLLWPDNAVGLTPEQAEHWRNERQRMTNERDSIVATIYD